MSGGFVGRRSHLETVSFYFIKYYVVSSVYTPTRYLPKAGVPDVTPDKFWNISGT